MPVLGIEVRTTGADKAAADLDKVAQASARAETATNKSGSAASSAFTEAARGINDYQRSVQQATSNVIPFRRSMDDAEKSAKAVGYQMRQLSFQVNDLATGLLSGQSPFQVMAQQGGQVYQVLQMGPGGVGGSLRAVAAQVAALVTPTTALVAGLTAAAAGFVATLASAVNYAKGLDDLSRITGIAAQQLEGLQKAAELKGIDRESLSAGLKAFSANMDDARLKTNDLRKLFELNGQAIKENIAANLETVARLIKNAETDMDRLRIAQIAGFEKSADTLRFFEQIGNTGVQAVDGVASAIDRDLIQKSRAFSEAWTAAWSDFKTSAQSAIVSAFAGLQSLVDKATDAFLEFSGRELDPASRIRRGFGAVGGGAGDPALQKALEQYAKRLRELNGVQEEAKTKVNIYGKEAKAAHEKAEKAVKEEVSEVQNLTTSFVQGFVSGIVDGKNAVESLGKALRGLGSSLLNSGIKEAINDIFSSNNGLLKQISGSLGIGNLANVLGVGSGLLTGGLTALLGGGLSFLPQLFGGDKDKDKANQQAAKQAEEAAKQLAEAQQRWREMASDFSSWINDWTTGVSGELHDAIESARSQMQQFANAALAAKDLGGVAAAQNAFNVGVTRSIGEALDELMNFGVETSSFSQQLKDARDKAEDIRRVLVDFGAAAEEASIAVESRLTVAIDRLRGQFLDDLVRKVNELAGGAWINQLTDLVNEVAQLRADAAAIGIQTALIDEFYVRAAQNIINENQLVGSAFDAVASTLGPLGAGLHEFVAAAEDAAAALGRSAQEIASTIQSYQDQLFVAQQDAQTLSGALAIFDLQAQRAREAEVAAGGQALVALEELQAQQRLNIIADFNQRALEEQRRVQEEQRRAQEEAAMAAQQAAEAQRRAFEEARNFIEQATRRIQDFINSLLTNAQSPLSPAARLAQAQSYFSGQYSSALGGNRDALNAITGNAQTVLDAAKALYGSSAGYQTIFNEMVSQLGALPAQLSPEQFIVDNLTPPLSTINSSVTSQTTTLQSSMSDLQTAMLSGNPQQIANALLPVLNSIDTNSDNAISFAEMQNALGATYSTGTLRAVFNELDGNGNGLLEKSELIKTASQGTSSNTNSLITGGFVLIKLNEIASNTLAATTQLGSIQGSASSTQTNTANTLNTLNNMKLDTAAILTNVQNVPFVRSILNQQNLHWGEGWAAAGSTYLQGQNIGTFEFGGYVDGRPHYMGGRNINVEGGEYVINRRDTSWARPLLDQINYGHRVPAANDNRDLIARLDRLERRLVAATLASGEMVVDGVAEVASEQRELKKRLRRPAA